MVLWWGKRLAHTFHHQSDYGPEGPANMLLGHDLTPPLLELSDCYAHWMALYEALVWL